MPTFLSIILSDGNNYIVLAPTAGGKTDAAIFPVLSGCLTLQEAGLRVLYICPTRALINNQEKRLGEYAAMVGLGAFKIVVKERPREHRLIYHSSHINS